MQNMDIMNDKLTKVVITLFEKNGVPLLVQNVSISNVKPDKAIWDAENAKFAAMAQVATIDSVGAALRRNPAYAVFKRFDTYENIAKNNKGNIQFTIIDGQPAGVVVNK
jgi:hypothetical protein